jgi:tRNA(Ile)-lysidine synthase
MRRALRQWLCDQGVVPEQILFAHIQSLEALLARKGGVGRVAVAGRVVERSYERLFVRDAGVDVDPELFRAAVRVPGETVLIEQGLRIRSWRETGVHRETPAGVGALPARASLSLKRVGRRRVWVRSWRHGDRIRPLGMSGSRKLQDIFVDAKVPAARRSGIPVFVCGGEIVWIPGYRLARGWEVGGDEDRALQLEVCRM